MIHIDIWCNVEEQVSLEVVLCDKISVTLVLILNERDKVNIFLLKLYLFNSMRDSQVIKSFSIWENKIVQRTLR